MKGTYRIIDRRRRHGLIRLYLAERPDPGYTGDDWDETAHTSATRVPYARISWTRRPPWPSHGAWRRWSHAGQWDSYRGTYIATSDITVFTFKNLRSQNQNVGNLLDNIIFTKAYKLNYSGSGNTGGMTPKQSK